MKKQLIKSTIYISIFIIYVGLLYLELKQKSLGFSTMEIPKEFGGIFLIIILFTFLFHLQRIYGIISSLYFELSDESKLKTKFILNYYTGVFNPFSETNYKYSSIFDNLGFGLQGFVLLISEFTALRLNSYNKSAWISLLFYVIIAMLLIFNHSRITEIKLFMNEICKKSENRKRKLAGIIGFFSILIWILVVGAKFR